MKYKPQAGDYVVATVWSDGDPQDPWCVGFYVTTRPSNGGIKYLVEDAAGKLFRTDGFRRVKRISFELGNFLVNNKEQIEESGRSIYSHLRIQAKLKAAKEE